MPNVSWGVTVIRKKAEAQCEGADKIVWQRNVFPQATDNNIKLLWRRTARPLEEKQGGEGCMDNNTV